MKSIHWEHATDFGHELEPGVFVLGYDANDDGDYTGQDTLVFGEQSKEACINGVSEHFGKTIFALDEPIPVAKLFQGCVSQSTAAEKHLLAAINRLHASKDIIVVSKTGTLRQPSKIYRPDDIIEPSKQIRLIR